MATNLQTVDLHRVESSSYGVEARRGVFAREWEAIVTRVARLRRASRVSAESQTESARAASVAVKECWNGLIAQMPVQ